MRRSTIGWWAAALLVTVAAACTTTTTSSDDDDDDDDTGSGSETGTGGNGSGGGGDGGAASSTTAAIGSSVATTSAVGTAVATTGVATSSVATVGPGPSTATVGPGPSTSSGGGCTLSEFFGDPVCDECVIDSCCGEAQACIDNIDGCVDVDGNIDPGSQYGGPLVMCLQNECQAECIGGGGDGICTSGLTSGDAAYDQCLSDNCCQEHVDCTVDGTDPDSCIECFQAGGGPLCDEAIACAAEFCDGGGGGGICDSGLTTNDPDYDQCLEDNCCQEHLDCTADGTDADACVACFQAGGGPLCDAAIACAVEFCEGEATGICDSGLTSGDPVQDDCLAENCCDQHEACTAQGEDPDSCIACFEAGGGPLCDEAIACGEEFCP